MLPAGIRTHDVADLDGLEVAPAAIYVADDLAAVLMFHRKEFVRADPASSCARLFSNVMPG
ncbi:MAG: hypothetical protein K6G29_08245 [Clostridiales bacterium]|nr:hypothetical protein [Clostridiales bacterium]